MSEEELLNEEKERQEEISNVLQLKQLVLEGTPNELAELADRELLKAYNDLAHKALTVMTTPSPAMDAIHNAKRCILTGLRHLIDPLNPCHAKTIASAAVAHAHLEDALLALDSECTGKFIEDAIVSVARAVKAIAVARGALKPKHERETASAPSRRRR
jgi:hypothetical protein